jgi:hypothetical protein
MKRFTTIFTAVALLFLAGSCAKETPGVPVAMNDEIVLSFSSSATKAASVSHEAYIHHVDIIVYECDEYGTPGEWKHSERINLLGTSTALLSAKRSDFISGSKYYIQVVANSSKPAEFFNEIKYAVLSNEKQEDPTVLFTGISGAGPEYFLMDGVATLSGETSKAVVINNGIASDNTELAVTLERAAAKIEIIVKAGSSDEFDITFSQTLQHSEMPSYYVRNLPYETFLLDHDPSYTTKLATTSNTRTEYMDFGSKQVGLVAYAYPHEWHHQSVLTHEPCVVVNLPFVYTDKQTMEAKEYPNSWYKIPMSADYMFDRNMYYRVEITVNRAGATTMLDPHVVQDIKYEVIP